MSHDLHFLRPQWLWLLVPLALVLWRLARTKGGDAWRGLVDAHLLPRLLTEDGGRALRLPLALIALGWLLGVLALAGPVWERLPQPVYQAQAFRVIALDLSPSMNATDLPPSRLAHARFEVLDLLRKAREGQTALLAYGAEPYVVSPLTSDTNTIAAQVPSLETGLLPSSGARRTGSALETAGDLLRQAGAPEGEVILVTDGVDHPAAALDEARRLRSAGYRVTVLGVGSAKGAPVPLAEGGFLKDGSGAILMPKLDIDALQRLATTGGGRYVSAGPDDRDIEALIPDRSPGLAQQAEKQQAFADQWREEGPWLLLLLLPLAALGFRRGWLTPLVLLVALAPAPDANAFGWDDLWLRPDQQAQRLMQAGQPERAAEVFQRPDWRAAAQYESGDYEHALQTLQGIENGEADYNLGNALARQGQLEEAIAAYDRALADNPEDEDARHNRDLVQSLLDQGQQEQQAQEQGQQGDQEETAQKDQSEQQGGQGQGEQAQKGQQSRQAQDEGQNPDAESKGGQPGGEKLAGAESRQEQQAEQSQGEKEQGEEGEQAKGPQQGQQGQAGRGSEPDPKESKIAQAREPEQSSSSDLDNPRSEQDAPRSSEPGLQDLLGGDEGGTTNAQSNESSEERQAMEQALRRVEDDPGGLLRQRFLLQYLRRNGQLP